MGYQIVVTPAFTGDGLPDLAAPGFADDFNRPDSLDLGFTSTGNRPWRTSVSVAGTDSFAQIVNGEMGAAGNSGYSVSYAEAHVADVFAEATIAHADRSSGLTPNLRLAVRVAGADPARFVSIRWSNVAGAEYVWLDSYGDIRRTEQSGVLGDLRGRRLGVTAIGDAFTTYLDGVQIIPPTTIPGLGGITTHGIQANNSANAARLDNITVTPA